MKSVVTRYTQLILNGIDDAAFIENRFISNSGYDPLAIRAGDRAAAFTSYAASERETVFLLIPFQVTRPKVSVVILRSLGGVLLRTFGADFTADEELLNIVRSEE